jgi:hypothetical protein
MGPEKQETKYTTSFIPKKPVATPKTATVIKRGPNILSLIGLFIFLASILGVVGVYVWRYQLENQIETQLDDLRKARSEFDEQTVANATRLNERIIAVKDLLNNHKAPSNLFSVLESSMLQTVRLRNLNYQSQEDNTIKINGSGEAANFEAVVLQSDAFGDIGNFRDVIFSDVQTNQDGTSVSFSFSSSIEDNLVLYRKKLDNSFGVEVETFDEPAENASSFNIFKR